MSGIPHCLGLFLLLATSLVAAPGRAETGRDSITLHFYERPPFHDPGRRAGGGIVSFPDVKAGGTRHIYCSANVTAAEIRRLNQAIAARRK